MPSGKYNNVPRSRWEDLGGWNLSGGRVGQHTSYRKSQGASCWVFCSVVDPLTFLSDPNPQLPNNGSRSRSRREINDEFGRIRILPGLFCGQLKKIYCQTIFLKMLKYWTFFSNFFKSLIIVRIRIRIRNSEFTDQNPNPGGQLIMNPPVPQLRFSGFLRWRV